MFKKPPDGTKISPACAYCTHGSPAADQKMVLCKNRGVVSPYFACRKFRYDPLLRVRTGRNCRIMTPKISAWRTDISCPI